MSYRPSYLNYSKAPTGWHDEHFDYCFNFQFTYSAPISAGLIPNLPLQFDPDADFYARGIAILIDAPPVAYVGGTRISFNMRMRDAWGRPLDDNFVPMQVYATNPFANIGPYPKQPGAPHATPIPELYCKASCVMYLDLQSQNSGQEYSFHIFLVGVKRFKDEECKPA
jgi:hypothetical protein